MANRIHHPKRYEYDPGKYAAACRWLGHATLPPVPLPEFLYNRITDYMVQNGDKWEFDAASATRHVQEMAQDRGIIMDKELSPRMFETFLKATFKGMYFAHAQGYKHDPEFFGVIENATNPGGGTTLGRDLDGAIGLCILNPHHLAHNLEEIDLLKDIKQKDRFNAKMYAAEESGIWLQIASDLLQRGIDYTPEQIAATHLDLCLQWAQNKKYTSRN